MRPTLPLAALAFLLAGPAAADSSIRCDGGLVAVGDTKLDLLARCGVPALRDVRGKVRAHVLVRGDEGVSTRSRRVASELEQWTYDFGPSRFTGLVTLEGGRVTAVEYGGYGYAQGDPRDAPAIPVSRCAPTALQEGATALDLLARCGEPATVDRHTVERAVSREDGGQVVYVSDSAEVEVWTYNFGPRRFLALVTLEAGRVVRVERGGYGYSG